MSAVPTDIESYYRLHAGIYDATRWSFLFGRSAILRELANEPARVLEVGCGTGRNLAALCRKFPRAEVTGVDLAAPMLERAARKCAPFGARARLLQRAYDAPLDTGGFGLVLFSYALSMFNPGFAEAIAAAQADLAPGGRIAVVDFHDTPLPFFARWMRMNHVRMEGQLRPELRTRFIPAKDELRRACGGVWRYLFFVGSKRADS